MTSAPPRPGVPSSPDDWFTEALTPNEWHSHRIKKMLVRARTPFQNAVLADFYSFGRCLILDDEIQSAQLDEFIYHESLVHPALVMHPHVRDVLILGGGEGATVREILRHRSVKRVTMVDIDAEVVSFCKRYMKSWHQGTLQDARARLVIQDAAEFVRDTKETFDVIISDLPTPLSGSPVASLYTPAFYQILLKRLRRGGIFVAQAGPGNILQIDFHRRLYQTLARLFKVVRPYYAFVPSFDGPWSFLFCSQSPDPKTMRKTEVNHRLGTIKSRLRFYDGETHEGLFQIPKYLRATLGTSRFQ